MRKGILLTAAAAVMMTFAACGNKSGGDATEAKQDSIMEENRYLNSFIENVAQGMDSLVAGQDMLLKTSPEGTPLNARQQITENLKVFEELVNRQRNRIAELEKSLADNKSAYAQNMKKIVSALKAQLAEKDKEIAALKEELKNKDFDISNLNQRVASLNQDVEGLTTKNKAQKEALITQSDMMNEAYVLIATKKELKASGLLSSAGLFSKSKLKSSELKTYSSMFRKVDIRNYTSVKISGKKPKVLTPAPASSYSLTDNGDGTSTLNITDPTAFWGVSNYLVIQTK